MKSITGNIPQLGCRSSSDGAAKTRLKFLFDKASSFDPAEKAASYGRWWYDITLERFIFSEMAAQLLDVESACDYDVESCFAQVVPEDLMTLTHAIDALKHSDTMIDCEIRFIDPESGLRWLRIASIRDETLATDIRQGILSDATASRRAAMREKFGFEATQCLVGASTLPEAITGVLRSVCENLGWEWGAYWEVREDESWQTFLACRYFWNDSKQILASFEEESLGLNISPGIGLVGSVWTSGQAKWVSGPPQPLACPRFRSVRQCGVKSGFAFPIILPLPNGTLRRFGVMEFCSIFPRQREAQLPNLAKSIAAIVAQTIQRIEHVETIRRMAQTDAMTGLANREHFHQQINNACHEAEVNKLAFGVLYIDLDRFKPINDAYGHDAGNFVLLEFSRRLQENTPPGSIVGRLGGDEFAVLSPPYASKAELDDLAKIVLDAAQMPFLFGEIELAVSASIGISVYPENGTSMPELLRNADAAMYRSKHDGRNSFCYADGASPSMQSAIVHQLTIEVAMHHALLDNEFFLEYQPIFDSFSGNMVGIEALIRWQRGDGEIVRPDLFIPIAEKSRLIVRLGRWVLQQACCDLAALHRAGFKDLCVNVNMAVAEFTSQDLAAELLEAVSVCGINPQYVCLEVTEGMVMQHADKVIPVMQELRKQGFRISLDDFGMGHSSLSRLKSLPISVLKIDRSFIRGLPSETQDCAIVRTIFDLAWHMNLQIVAEGVETDAQLSYLSQFGYPMIQGYLLGRPMPLQAVMTTFQDRKSIAA